MPQFVGDGVTFNFNGTTGEWPTLACGQANLLEFSNGDLQLDAARSVRLQGSGQLSFANEGQISAQGALRLRTGGPLPGERLLITAEGKVGIGTADPTQALEVNGAVMATDFIKGATSLVSSQWSDVAAGINYAGGRVGIGIASPGQALEVDGVVKATDFMKGSTPLVSSQWADVAGGIHYMQGNVGLGIATPAALLDVNGEIITRQALSVTATNNTPSVLMTKLGSEAGFIQTTRQDGLVAMQLTTRNAAENEEGYLAIFDKTGNYAVWLSADGVGTNGALWSKGSVTTTDGLSVGAWASVGGTVWAEGGVSARNGLWVRNDDNRTITYISTTGAKAGYIGTYLNAGRQAIALTTTGSGDTEQGYLSIYDAAGGVGVWAWSGGVGTNGSLWSKGGISTQGGLSAQGWLSLDGGVSAKQTIWAENGVTARNAFWTRNGNNSNVVLMTTTTSAGGFIQTYRGNGSPAVRITTAAGDKAGWLGVYKEDGNLAHWLDGAGGKSFVMRHPNDPSQNIVYTAIEGPEAAAYFRAQGQLTNGQASIEFPEHFTLVVNPATITIQLTPRSADSKGLAVVEQSAQGFVVKELLDGNGSYLFDYFVAGVRQGMEHYKPVVPIGYTALGAIIDESSAVSEMANGAMAPSPLPIPDMAGLSVMTGEAAHPLGDPKSLTMLPPNPEKTPLEKAPLGNTP